MVDSIPMKCSIVARLVVPQLKNALWERFAQASARGVNGKNAAREAGYGEKSAHVRACELLKKDEVKARIAELKAKAEKHIVQEVAVSEAWVLQKLVGNVEAASEAKDRAAVNRGLELIAKMKGYMVERKMDVTDPLSHLNASQIQALTSLAERVLAAEQPAATAAVDLGSAEPANSKPA